jgi:chemotaxis protein methyltransferase WspC
MDAGPFEKLLRDSIGLNQDTVGPSVIRQALRRRMAACEVSDLHAYWRQLDGNATELQELIDAVIVPETWFFRDREAFAAAARHAAAHRRAGDPVRLLSLPCSTGEEPFTMAMALFAEGLEARDFVIDAIDVSTRNLAYAKRAIYGRNSFRGDDLSFRARYFDEAEGGWRPHDEIRQQVRFAHGNILAGAAPLHALPYDIVFCRNLLIYFDREGQAQAIDRLHRSLAPRGMLFVGPAESGLPSLYGFASARLPMAFAFIKASAVEPAAPPARKPLRPTKPAAVAKKAVAPKSPPTPLPFARKTAEPAPAIPTPDAATSSLAAIEQAANAGRLADAQVAAARHLREFGPSSEAYYLLGLAHDAQDASGEAVANYRKALYLEPDHRQALAHLRLLLQRQGEVNAANALSERLARIQKRSGA